MSSKKPILLATNDENLIEQCKKIFGEKESEESIIISKIPEESRIPRKINPLIVQKCEACDAILVDLRIYYPPLEPTTYSDGNLSWQYLEVKLVEKISYLFDLIAHKEMDAA